MFCIDQPFTSLDSKPSDFGAGKVYSVLNRQLWVALTTDLPLSKFRATPGVKASLSMESRPCVVSRLFE